MRAEKLTHDRLKKFPPLKHVHVAIFTPRGTEWVSTGQTEFEMARKICTRAMLEKLTVERSGAVLQAEAAARGSGTRIISPALIAEWETYITPILAPNTVYLYIMYLGHCFKDLLLYDKPLTGVDHEMLSRWVNCGKKNTRGLRLSVIRAFFKYVNAMGYLQSNPAVLVRIRLRDMTHEERTSHSAEPFTEAEYRQILAYPKLKPFWRAAVIISYWSALRLRDICCLEWASIKADSLSVYQQKTGDLVEHKFDHVAISAGELQVLLEELPRNDSPYCFPEYRQKILNPSQRSKVGSEFTELLGRLGIEGKSFHGIRHTASVRLRSMGQSREQISKFLGHRSLESSETYLNHPEIEVDVCT